MPLWGFHWSMLWIYGFSGGVVWRGGNGERFLLSGAEGECRRWVWGSCDSKSKNWLGEVQGMQGSVAELKKVLAEAERNGLSELCKISDVIREWDKVFEGKWDGNFKKDWESNGESNVRCKTDGEKENRRPDGDVRIEGKQWFRWQRLMEWDNTACVEEGWWARSEKSIGVWSEGQEEARRTTEDVEDACGDGEHERWFGEKGRHELSEIFHLILTILLLQYFSPSFSVLVSCCSCSAQWCWGAFNWLFKNTTPYFYNLCMEFRP